MGADLPLAGHDEQLAEVLRAVRFGCLLRYRYNGSARVAHPQAVRTQHGKWYLLAREDGAVEPKVSVVARMSDVHADEAHTAASDPEAQHPGHHPIPWLIDPPDNTLLRAAKLSPPDVRRWLGTQQQDSAGGGRPEPVSRHHH